MTNILNEYVLWDEIIILQIIWFGSIFSEYLMSGGIKYLIYMIFGSLILVFIRLKKSKKEVTQNGNTNKRKRLVK